jgi:hypothetical protein
MSLVGTDSDELVICEFCGEPIEEPLQQCPALANGVCEP